MRTNRAFNCAAVVACLIALAIIFAPRQRAPSLRTGCYSHQVGDIHHGEVVAFWLPSPAWSYAGRRGDLTHLFLIKQVLAERGDFFSTRHGELRINGDFVGAIASADPAGRSRAEGW